MSVRRALVVLMLLASMVALALPAAPIGTEGMSAMPCHGDEMPARPDGTSEKLRCCLQAWCAIIEPTCPTLSFRLRTMVAAGGTEAFASVTTRPDVPPPRA